MSDGAPGTDDVPTGPVQLPRQSTAPLPGAGGYLGPPPTRRPPPAWGPPQPAVTWRPPPPWVGPSWAPPSAPWAGYRPPPPAPAPGPRPWTTTTAVVLGLLLVAYLGWLTVDLATTGLDARGAGGPDPDLVDGVRRGIGGALVALSVGLALVTVGVGSTVLLCATGRTRVPLLVVSVVGAVLLLQPVLSTLVGVGDPGPTRALAPPVLLACVLVVVFLSLAPSARFDATHRASRGWATHDRGPARPAPR